MENDFVEADRSEKSKTLRAELRVVIIIIQSYYSFWKNRAVHTSQTYCLRPHKNVQVTG